MNNFENNEYPKVYKASISQRIINLAISFVILIAFFIALKSRLEIYSENIYIRYFLIAIFLLIFVNSIFGAISVFKNELIIYENKLIYKTVFSTKELYFSEILGYEERFRNKRTTFYIIPKDGYKNQIDISLFRQNREVLSFIKNKFDRV